MKDKDISIGGEYLCWTNNGFEFIKIMQYVEGMGYWVKDIDGEVFWADAEELEEV